MHKRVTQKDIARKLQLSQSLVANVLNNRPGIWISEENRQRILVTARDLGYRPHAAARALRRGKTGIVGCVFYGAAGYHAVIERLADGLAQIGYDLLVKVIHPKSEAPTSEQFFASGADCDALVLWGLEQEIDDSATTLAALGIPFLVKGRFEETHPDWLQVEFDHEGMMRQAVHHLAEWGHRRIAYLGYDNPFVYARKLVEGFRAAMQTQFGASVRDDFIGRIGSQPQATETWLARRMMLPETERPTALVMGVGSDPWQEIELWLAQRGQRIGDTDGALAVCGQRETEAPLLFGDAWAYSEVALADLAQAITERALIPLLTEKTPPERVIRLLPALRPCATLRLPIVQKPSMTEEREKG